MYALVLTESSAIMAHMPLKYGILFHCAPDLCQIFLSPSLLHQHHC